MKPYHTGVVIGKFYPPHRGHHHLICTASTRCERVYVLACWKPEQSVPIAVRLACLREEHPEAEVLPVPDTLDADDTPGWAAYTLRLLGAPPDAVFTSEEYGPEYARAMGAAHVMVDLERRTVPCSGTMIRANPLAHLDCLSPCMRAFYVLRVAVVGAESTGTTTLAEALARHYQTIWVPEYGREYCEEKWREGYTEEWTTEEFVHIAGEQLHREDEAARHATRVLICDTDAFATAIWHRRYVGTRSPEVEALAGARHYALYLLTGDEIPFVQDGLRDGEHIRHEMHALFERELAATGRRWMLVRGSLEERVAQASERIDELIGRAGECVSR